MGLFDALQPDQPSPSLLTSQSGGLLGGPLDPTTGVPQGQAWNPLQDYMDWYNRGGVSQYMGLPPASQQIWDSQQKSDALPADAPLSARMDAQKDNPLAFMAGVDMPIRAFHGSPYSFDKFDLSKIGTGEGAQAYGHGLYFAGNEDVARSYRDTLAPPRVTNRWFAKSANPQDLSLVGQQLLDEAGGDVAKAIDGYKFYQSLPSRNDDLALMHSWVGKNYKPGGSMYEVALHADPASLLDWDKPLGQQPAGQTVQQALLDKIARLRASGQPLMHDYVREAESGSLPGSRAYTGLGDGSAPSSSQLLNQAGIPGIRYLDGGSRAAGDGTRNYVMFNPDIIEILRKYGVAAPYVGGAAALGAADQ